MTVEIYEEASYKLSTRSKGYALRSSCVDLSTIKATQAAIEFYKEQAKAKQTFDDNEKENKLFWEAVKTFTSYPDRYKLSPYWQDCLVSLWDDRCKENPFLEKYCTHGTDCKKINNCSCYNKPGPKKRRKGKKEKEAVRY
jgi:hypothetical protein